MSTREQSGSSRRGSVLVGVLIALSLLLLMVGAVVLAGGRDATMSVDRLGALRAEFNAEAASAIALRELVTGSDIDGNGTTGTFNTLTLNSGQVSATAGVLGDVTTVTATGLAAGSGGTGAVRSANQLAVRRTSTGRPGLFFQAWEGMGWINVSAINWNATPTIVGWVPNIDYANRSSGESVYRGQSGSVAIKFVGRITVSSAGTWGFGLDHDDGVELLINGTRVVFFDGGTGCRWDAGSINLSAGTHNVELRFTDGGGDQCLTLRWEPPGSGTWTVIPATAFTHVPTHELPPLVTVGTATFTGTGSAGSLLVNGYRNSSGPWTGTAVAGIARVSTGSSSAGSMPLSSGAQVDGIAWSPPGSTATSVITLASNASVTGGRAAASLRYAVPIVYVPTSFSAASSGALNQTSGTLNISGDRRYSSFAVSNAVAVNVTGNARLVIDGNVSFRNTSTLNIPAGATLDMFVSGFFDAYDTAQVNATGDPDRLRIYQTSTFEWSIDHAVRLSAHVRVPRAAADIWPAGQSASEFVGTIMSNTFGATSVARVRLDAGPAVGSGSGGTTAITSWVEP